MFLLAQQVAYEIQISLRDRFSGKKHPVSPASYLWIANAVCLSTCSLTSCKEGSLYFGESSSLVPTWSSHRLSTYLSCRVGGCRGVSGATERGQLDWL